MRKRITWIASASAVVLIGLGVAITAETRHRYNQPAPDPNLYRISFVTDSLVKVPDWLDHGNGIGVVITIDDWQALTSGHDGVVVIPTSTDPSEVLSIDSVGSPLTTQGFGGGWGVGPQHLIDAMNAYLKQHNLATLSANETTTFEPYSNDIHLRVADVIGNHESGKIDPKDVRLMVICFRARGDHYHILWGHLYAPEGVAGR